MAKGWLSGAINTASADDTPFAHFIETARMPKVLEDQVVKLADLFIIRYRMRSYMRDDEQCVTANVPINYILVRHDVMCRSNHTSDGGGLTDEELTCFYLAVAHAMIEYARYGDEVSASWSSWWETNKEVNHTEVEDASGRNNEMAESESSHREEQVAKRRRGGFSREAKGMARNEGMFVAAGGPLRFCLADALWTLLMNVRPELSLEQRAVRKALPGTKRAEDDPSEYDATLVAKQYGVALQYLPNTSPCTLLKHHHGVFLVRLLLFYDGDPDEHYICFHAATGRLLDNRSWGPIIRADDGDRKNNKKAMRPFKALFPDATKIRVDGVHIGWRSLGGAGGHSV